MAEADIETADRGPRRRHGAGDEELPHSGFAAVVGRPSCGKSSFLNTLCGHKVSIVSPIPQTTREYIRAIHNEKDMHIVFVDTPGMHKSAREYNRKLSKLALDSLAGADAVLCLLDLSRDFGEEEKNVLEILAVPGRQERTVVACNKADLISPDIIEKRKADVLEIIAPHAVYSISALKKDDVLQVARSLGGLLPPGPRLYPEGYYTDQTQRHRVAEVIREKIFLNMKEEIPHASCVLVEELRFIEEAERIRAVAVIYVESESQKGMVIGARGRMIRELGISARADLEDIFGYGVDLFLRVEVRRAWRKDKIFLRLLERQYQG
jgi:GTP-binding protein Era